MISDTTSPKQWYLQIGMLDVCGWLESTLIAAMYRNWISLHDEYKHSFYIFFFNCSKFILVFQFPMSNICKAAQRTFYNVFCSIVFCFFNLFVCFFVVCVCVWGGCVCVLHIFLYYKLQCWAKYAVYQINWPNEWACTGYIMLAQVQVYHHSKCTQPGLSGLYNSTLLTGQHHLTLIQMSKI